MRSKGKASTSHLENDSYMEEFSKLTLKEEKKIVTMDKAIEGLKLFAKQQDTFSITSTTPQDTSGYCYDVSDRNLFTIDYLKDLFVVGGADHGLKEYSLTTGKEKRNLYSKTFGHCEWITKACYLADGRVITGGMDSKVLIWNSAGNRGVEITSAHSGSISDIVVSNCNNYFITSSYDKTIKVWSSSNKNIRKQLLISLEEHKAPVLNLKLSKSKANYLLSGDRNGTALLWDIESGKRLRIFKDHKGHISTINFINDEEGDSLPLAVTADQSGTVCIWDQRQKEAVAKMLLHPGGAVSFAEECNKGNSLITVGADKRILILNSKMSFDIESKVTHHKDFIYSLSVNGSTMFSGNGSGLILAHDLNSFEEDGNCKLLYGLKAHMGAVRCIVCPKTNVLLTCGDDGKAIRYEY